MSARDPLAEVVELLDAQINDAHDNLGHQLNSLRTMCTSMLATIAVLEKLREKRLQFLAAGFQQFASAQAAATRDDFLSSAGAPDASPASEDDAKARLRGRTFGDGKGPPTDADIARRQGGRR